MIVLVERSKNESNVVFVFLTMFVYFRTNQFPVTDSFPTLATSTGLGSL